MNIFVAKLSYDTSEDTLRDTFEEFGEVSSAKIIMDKFTGRSKGFGFVEMPNDDEAQAAINVLPDGINSGNGPFNYFHAIAFNHQFRLCEVFIRKE